MIIFVNGKIGGGSPPCGIPYWTKPNTPFVDQAKEYLKDQNTWILEIDHSALSHTKERYEEGYRYGIKNRDSIAAIINKGETVKFIAHSMGCSFAEGMANYLIEQGYRVNTMIHINAFQAAEMLANSDIKQTIDFQYTDDVILRIPFVSHVGAIKGAISIRKKSHLWIRRRHRGPIYPCSNEFWKDIKGILEL